MMSVIYIYNKMISEDFILLDIAIMNRGLGEYAKERSRFALSLEISPSI